MNGQFYATASQRVWDAVCANELDVLSQHEACISEEKKDIYALLHQAVQQEGKSVYANLQAEHLANWENQREKGEYSFRARKRAIERVGLPEVRQYRLRQLESEYHLWLQNMDMKQKVVPDIALHAVFEIQG